MSKEIKLSEHKQDLYLEVKKLVKRANQRIVRLEREFGEDSWAYKQLRNALDIRTIEAITPTKRVKINKSLSTRQLNYIKKHVNKFLGRKTSRVKGVKEVIAKQKEGIKQSLIDSKEFTGDADEVVDSLTDKDVEVLYSMFKDDDAKELIDLIGSSDFWVLVKESRRFNTSYKDFLDSIKIHLDLDYIDKESKALIKRVYDKFVKR